MTEPTTPPPVAARDAWLPARLAAVGVIVAGERDVYQDYARMLDQFFTEVRSRVLKPLLRQIDPAGVFGGIVPFLRMVDRFVFGTIQDLLGESYGRVLGDNYPFTNRPFVAKHLEQVRNRMVRLPDEVFDHIRVAVDEGISEGDSIPELSERIDQQLLRADAERWKNRATVVARTETMAAYNWGTLDAYDVIAEVTDEKLEKVWLATMDHRTRDTHFIADGQRVPLGSPFIVGGFPGMVPGDPSLPPQESIQCRCTFLVVDPGETLGYYGGETDAKSRGPTLRGYRPDAATQAEINRRAARGVIRAGDQP